MAKQPDILGLFTGISNKPIDPTGMTESQQRSALQNRGLLRAREDIVNALGKQTAGQKQQTQRADYLANFDNLSVEEQKKAVYQLQAAGQTGLAGQLASRVGAKASEAKRLKQLENLANALPPEYASLAIAIRNGVEGAVQKGVEVLAREKKAPAKRTTDTVNIEIDGVVKKALIDDQTGEVIKTFDVEEDRDMIEEVDPVTGQTLNYSVKKDGTDKTLIGVKSLPEYDMVKQDDGTYTVLNKTTAGVVQENIPTAESGKIAKQKYAKTVQSLHDIDRQIGFIDESKALTDEYISFLYPLAKYVPTFDARKQKAMVESLQSNLAMNKLMELKRNSTTGASGLGALNQAELIMLQDSLGKLDPAAGDEAFKRQLDLVKKHYTRFRQTLMGITPQIDWENPEYSKFTRTVTDAYGEERKFYFLSDEFGQPQTDPQTGEIQWYEVPRVTIK
jgi:hypothetical protein